VTYFPDYRRERKRLLAWYRRSGRDLPWRRSTDPYRIWISEVMLQQTRVAAVIPYYERFLERFPDAASLAAASEAELLAAWSGLGYYQRARNLRKAARTMIEGGGLPSDYDSIRALPGVGDYTAAAVASIAFGLPHAAVDGNVLRVLARFTAEPDDTGRAAVRSKLGALAGRLLDRRRPGDFNQALMELGATVCLPRRPDCPSCPLQADCQAHQAGAEQRYPVKSPRPPTVRVERALLLIRRRGRLLLGRRGEQMKTLAGFWELPAPSDVVGASKRQRIGRFRHAIVNHDYHVTVWEASVSRKPSGLRWVPESELARLPLTTATRKALRLAGYDP
jgi:A/G-specific adenine glycosylase